MIDVGSHVVCIFDFTKVINSMISKYNKNFMRPQLNKVYTVRSIPVRTDGIIFLRFEELINPPFINGGLEPGYNIKHFKPLKKLDANQWLSVKIKEDA